MVSDTRLSYLTKRRFWLLAGFGLSIALAALVIARLDWAAFRSAVADIHIGLMLAAVLPFSASIVLRALRWTLVTQEPVQTHGRFWAATVLGYLGNYIYPLRAGEVIRVAALNRIARVPVGRGAASAVLDRLSDTFMLGLLVVVVAGIHSVGLMGAKAVVLVVVVLFAVPAGVVTFAVWGGRLTGLVQGFSRRLPGSLGARLPTWYAQAFELASNYKNPWAIALIVGLTILVFGIDLLTIWTLLFAFGWVLPFEAALTLEVFLQISSVLPSAPSYIGVYQAASVLALSLYGIDASGAVALSIVIQFLFLFVVVLKAAWAGYHYRVGSSVLAVGGGAAHVLSSEEAP